MESSQRLLDGSGEEASLNCDGHMRRSGPITIGGDDVY